MTRRHLTFHGGASAADRDAEDHADRRSRFGWRTMHLIHGGQSFLRRAGVDGFKLAGIVVHHIDGPDPGKDLHDHPWPFVSIILRGGYTELRANTRSAPALAAIAEESGNLYDYGEIVMRPRFSTRRMPLTDCHRIIGAKPGTMTLMLRGRKFRSWGFYQPEGYVDSRLYDYATRRPVHEAGPDADPDFVARYGTPPPLTPYDEARIPSRHLDVTVTPESAARNEMIVRTNDYSRFAEDPIGRRPAAPPDGSLFLDDPPQPLAPFQEEARDRLRAHYRETHGG